MKVAGKEFIRLEKSVSYLNAMSFLKPSGFKDEFHLDDVNDHRDICRDILTDLELW